MRNRCLGLALLAGCAASTSGLAPRTAAQRAALGDAMREDAIGFLTAVSPAERPHLRACAIQPAARLPAVGQPGDALARGFVTSARDAAGCLHTETWLRFRDGAWPGWPVISRTRFECDASGRITQVIDEDADPDLNTSFEVRYDDAGRRHQFVRAGEAFNTFAYDARGRILRDKLLSVVYDDVAMTTSFRYDQPRFRADDFVLRYVCAAAPRVSGRRDGTHPAAHDVLARGEAPSRR
jgi:hypothetical protein